MADQGMKPTIFGIVITVMVLMVVFSSARIYSKARMERGIRIDDWLLLAAAAFALPLGILTMVSTSYGVGLHNANLDPLLVLKYLKISFGYEIVFIFACALPKLSLCATYLFLFPSKANKIFCWSCIAFVIGWTITSVFETIFQCLPIASIWDPTILDKRCVNANAALMALAALNSLTDFAVYLWPARALWKVQLPLRQRLGLIVTFGCGSIVCVAGILRIYYLDQLQHATEQMYVGGIVGIIATVESNVGVLCCCLHGIRPLLASLFPRIFKTTSRTYGSKSNTYGKDGSKAFQSLPGDDERRLAHKPNKTFGSSAQKSSVYTDDEEIELGPTYPRSQVKAWASGGGAPEAPPPQHGIFFQKSVITTEGAYHGDRGKANMDSNSEEYILKDATLTQDATK